MDILIIGAGGHAHVVADIIQCMRLAALDVRLIGYLDDACHLHGNVILGAPVLGPISALQENPHDAVIVAIGDNRIRSRCFEKLRNAGETLAVARHPGSIIASDVEIGYGSMICAGVVVNTGAIIGENVILNTGCTVDHHDQIANHAHIAPGAHLGGEVHVGEGTLIGLGASVMPRRRLGAWSIVAAGGVVNRDLPDAVTAIGVPARVVNRASDP
jgi:sugar O-acyltransferase (sialic acid O-acetyltransferase NeuD family)